MHLAGSNSDEERHQPGAYRPNLVVAGVCLMLGGLGLVIYVFRGLVGADVATQRRVIRPLS